VFFHVRAPILGDSVHHPSVLIAPQRRHRLPAAFHQLRMHFFKKRGFIHDRLSAFEGRSMERAMFTLPPTLHGELIGANYVHEAQI
jgi:hypothetical protein